MFDIALMALSIVVFVLNTTLLKQVSSHWLLHYYLNDILAGFFIISYLQLVLRFSKYRINIKSNILLSFIAVLCIGLFWEYGVLLIKPKSTPDVFDIVAYLVGMGFNLAVDSIFLRLRKH